MIIYSWLIIAIVVVAFFAWRAFSSYKASQEYEKMLLNLPKKGEGWIEFANRNSQPLMFGKVLDSFDGYITGVGVVAKEQFPTTLVSDIDIKIDPQLIEGMPLCRFIIDGQGQELIFSEFKDMELKDKLKPYVDDYSKIKLMLGFEAKEYVLVDSQDAVNAFEYIWQVTKTKKKLQ